jgi:branched-chain amino acid transport system ATP-binding protein
MSLLEVDRINTLYGDSHVLFDLSIRVDEGEVVALLGRNGAGKTTTLRSIMGVLAPKSGEIRLDGKPISGLAPSSIANMGVQLVPEERAIFGGLTVEENLRIAALTAPNAWSFERIYGVFPRLKERRKSLGRTLSGGEQQMLSLARAIITEPKLLMVDELSLGLAPRLVAQLFDTLDKIRQDGTTILLVEQYVRYALRLADIVVIMHKGQIGFIGEPGELAHEGKLVEAYLGGTTAAQATAEAEEQEATSASATSGARPTRKTPGPRGSTRRSSPS